MKDFMFIFRSEPSAFANHSPEELQARMQLWMDWIGGIAAQGKLVDRGNRLAAEGKIVGPTEVITDGPFIEIKESIAGYTMIKAGSLEEAAEMAKGCPVLRIGGNVEVRPIDAI